MKKYLVLLASSLALLAGCEMDAGDATYAHGDYHPSTYPDTSAENYEHYGTNPFVAAEEDDLITFSIDVDTASYTISRRDLMAGRLPDPASVRVEEFINFFNYRDQAPDTLEDTFELHSEVAPSPFGEGKHLLRVAMKGFEIPEDDRPPANLVFLVDVSGSMQASNKLGLVKYSLIRLTQTLRPDDQVAIVTYAGQEKVVLPPTPVAQANRILAAVENLSSGGSTNGSAGIMTAYRLAEQARDGREATINRVILCSDGDFNVGVTGDSLLTLIEDNRERGISLSVFGFGYGNYNDRDMEQMANRGNGNYAFIDREVEAERVLVRSLNGTLMTIAKDAKIQINVNSGVISRYRLVGYENRDIADDDFRNDAVDAGELGTGHTVTALVELELKDGVQLNAVESLGKMVVRFKSMGPTEEPVEVLHIIGPASVKTHLDDTSRAFRLSAAVAEFAEILRGSEHSQDADFERVIDLASAAIDTHDFSQAEFVELVQIASELWSRDRD